MVDFSKYHITKPQNIEELFHTILQIIEEVYNSSVPSVIRNRRNKEKARMTDSELIAIKVIIECLKMSENKGYHFLKNNFPNLVCYIDRSRFNRSINGLMTVVKHIRKKLIELGQNNRQSIVDSFPIPVCKFGRAVFHKAFKGRVTYGYCASKKETYYGFKGHLLINEEGNPIDIVITKANVDDRDGLYELSGSNTINQVIADKGYIGCIEKDLAENGIHLVALKRKNSKEKLPKFLYRIYANKRRRIETTISQLVELFDIEKVRKISMLGFMLGIEVKLLSFNLLFMINKFIQSCNPSHISSLIFGY